jgi:hypothetical protein
VHGDNIGQMVLDIGVCYTIGVSFAQDRIVPDAIIIYAFLMLAEYKRIKIEKSQQYEL